MVKGLKMAKIKTAIKIPSPLVNLGWAIEIKGTHVHYVWPKGDAILACNESGNRIFAIESKPISGHRLEDLWKGKSKKIEKAMKLYSTWSEFDTSEGTALERPKGFVFNVDRCLMIVYSSDKWTGRIRSFKHPFEMPPKMWVNKKTAPTVVMLRGGKISITKDGIEG